MVEGGTATPGLAEDDVKQLLAKQAIPKLTAEAIRHLRVPKGLSSVDTPQLLLGREEGASGGPDPPNHNQMGLNTLAGPWQGGHPPASKHSTAGKPGTKPRRVNPSCLGLSHGAISRKS